MIEFIIEGIIEVVFEIFISILWWAILIPVAWLVSLPFILILAVFERGPYFTNVMDMLGAVHYFCINWLP